jgi:hypothetical protein
MDGLLGRHGRDARNALGSSGQSFVNSSAGGSANNVVAIKR